MDAMQCDGATARRPRCDLADGVEVEVEVVASDCAHART
jgi:hypothetical protein